MEKEMRTFVMGDIHGAHRALVQCLKRSNFDYEKDVLIQLGDVADGHRYVYECVEELLKIRNLIAIKGNHDIWLLEFIENDFHPVYWTYGGKGTILSYLEHKKEGKKICLASGSGYKTSLSSTDIPAAHQAFFRNQQLFHVTEDNRCFIHAGFDRTVAFDRQQETAYYWNRELWEEAVGLKENGNSSSVLEMATPFREVYIGHTPTTNWRTDQPMNAFNITNMDTGAGHLNGRLTIMDIDTQEYWQSDRICDLESI
ncbi:metallophosphoesterase [Flavobacterium dauae]|uniref:metallophosphoesterase n=1 Tax=Flavobacterium dauae TaxID=1563479 RepID=UPI00101B5141|nr:metallophosphoesterase [Flavobacterium dauae]WLD24333.1 metallophosphoesterase [Flavobacterium dauae]